MLAAVKGHFDIVQCLVDHGAKLDMENVVGLERHIGHKPAFRHSSTKDSISTCSILLLPTVSAVYSCFKLMLMRSIS